MVELLDKLQYYLSYPFVQYAIIVGVLIALCSSLLGVTLVLKRFSLIGDGLSHVAFGAMSVATIMKLTTSTIITIPVTILFAIFLLNGGKKRNINGDSLVAMISVGSLAFGYLVINLFSKSANISADVCTTLFGSTSILTLKLEDVIICIIMSIIVVLFYCIFYNRIFSVTFDESFTKAIGKEAELYNLIIAIITAIIIVLAMNLVGSLLISALIIFPALSAMRIMNSFKAVVIYSAILSVIGALTGMIVSILFSTPVGSTIVAIDIIIFFANYIIGKLK